MGTPSQTRIKCKSQKFRVGIMESRLQWFPSASSPYFEPFCFAIPFW